MMEPIRELFRQFGNLFRWWYVVAPWEQSVRVRMGTRVQVLGAGVHVRIPFADRVFRQSTRRRFIPVTTQTVTTTDGKAVTVSGALAYEIHDIGKLYDTLHDAQDTLEAEAAAAVARYIAGRSISALRPAGIETHVVESMDLTRYGLRGAEFAVTDFAAVRTYRLLQSQPKDWSHGAALNTERGDGEAPS